MMDLKETIGTAGKGIDSFDGSLVDELATVVTIIGVDR